MKIKTRIILVILGVTLCCFGILLQQQWRRSGLAEIHVLDVGQGDALLLVSPEEHQILMDGGPGDKILSLLPWYMPYHDREIDALILTHPHADHLEGLLHVFHHYTIDTIYMTQPVYESQMYEEWLKELTTFTGEIIFLEKGQSFSFGSLRFDVLYPYEGGEIVDKTNVNNASVVLKLTEEKTNRTALFSGDAEWEVEESLLQTTSHHILEAEFLKAGHHGSETSNSLHWLQTIRPNIVAISSGKGNHYGHPHQESLRHFEQEKAQVFRTDLQGNLSFYDLSTIAGCGESWHLKTAVEVLKIRIRDQCS